MTTPYTTFPHFHTESTPSSASELPYDPSFQLLSALPIPTSSSGPPKKSHARRQPPGHIPRPRNAFILFRCDFVAQRKVPPSVEQDHRNISRIAGRIWRAMSDAQKSPWIRLAEQEKESHSRKYASRRYALSGQSSSSPATSAATNSLKADARVKSGIVGDTDKRKRPPPHQVVALPARRSSSCPPPGSVAVLPIPISLQDAHGLPLATRDDLSRRPTQTTMYHSAMSDNLLLPAAAFTTGSLGYVFPWNSSRSRNHDMEYGHGAIAPLDSIPMVERGATYEPYPLLTQNEMEELKLVTTGGSYEVPGMTMLNWDSLCHENMIKSTGTMSDAINPFEMDFYDFPSHSTTAAMDAVLASYSVNFDKEYQDDSLLTTPPQTHGRLLVELQENIGAMLPGLSLEENDLSNVPSGERG